MHGVGLRRRHVQLPHLLPNITRHERHGRLHFGNHALGFLDTMQTPLAEAFLMGDRPNRVDLRVEITGHALVVATSPPIQIDTVVRVADGAQALGDRLALSGETLGLLASGFHVLRNLRQARCHLWGVARAALCRRVAGMGEGLVHPRAGLFRLRGGLGGGPLCDGQRGRDRLAPCMLHMEEVRRVMRPKVVFHIREKSRGFITGRLAPLAGETRKGLFHQGMPGVLSPCLRRLLQEHVVAHRLDPHQAQTSRTRFLLRQREVFGGHLVSQTRAFRLAVCHDGLFHATVDVLWRPLGGADTSIEARDRQEQTPQAHPTGPHCGPYQGDRQDKSMQEGETRNTLQKLNDRGTRVEARLVRPPRLQRGAGPLQFLGRLTLGAALGVQVAIPLKQVSAFEAIPALGAIIPATLLGIEDCSHSSLLLLQPLSW